MTPLDPPRRFGAVLRRLGPGLIVAGSIVGSGELIATTKVGAQSGFVLLWLILLGCLVKVFTQVEFGRAAVLSGRTALSTLDDLPGPRWRVGWAVWLWVLMTLLTLAQLGGIIGGVGQALAVAFSWTDGGRQLEAVNGELVRLQVQAALDTVPIEFASPEALAARLDDLRQRAATLSGAPDAALWAVVLALPTSVILVVGRFTLIQLVATALVVSFTIVTVATVVLLQLQPDWAIRADEIVSGLRLQLPSDPSGETAPMATALAAFGIIGVGAAEIVMYPYWCLEKGYAKFTGPQEQTAEWRARARGWIRVLQCDAWLSAGVYTFATVAFYLLGAAVLGRVGLDPEKDLMVRTLSEMYAPVFGSWATPMFLVAAFCVLYSTFFVGIAGLARVAADCVVRMLQASGEHGEQLRARWTRVFCGLLPIICLLVFVFVQAPARLVLAGGVAQALMLPVLGAAALWARHRRTDPALAPSRVWDLFLWLSCFAFIVVASWSLVTLLG
jgi:Mn2+/Fe2+ NRAMP family transporter